MRKALYAMVALSVAAAGGVAYQRIQVAQSALAASSPGTVDIGFAQSMGLHHQQAIVMAQLMLDGRPTPLANLARSILGTQLVELGEMRGWLRLWDQSLLPATRGMTWILAGDAPPDPQLSRYLLDCSQSPTGMVGLATDDELNRLRQLDGRSRDELFLRLMLAHHQGALPMAQFAAAQAHLAAVRELAGRIVMDQAQESAQISSMLQALAMVQE